MSSVPVLGSDKYFKAAHEKDNSWNDYFLHRAFFPCFLKTKIELDGHETFVLMDQTFR